MRSNMYSDLQPNSRDLAAIPITAAAICISFKQYIVPSESLQIAATSLHIAAKLESLHISAIWQRFGAICIAAIAICSSSNQCIEAL
jgi:hypothetical protein